MPVILLHGAASGWQPFRSILPVGAEKYHVYAVDLGGHGLSSRTPGAYSMDDFTGDIYEFISWEVCMPTRIYGHSLGALVGITLAASHPEDVIALILGDPPLYLHDIPTRNTFWHAAFTDRLELKNANTDPGGMAAWLAHNLPNMTPERREERIRSMEIMDSDAIRVIISDAHMKGASPVMSVPRVAWPVWLLCGNQKLESALREQDVNFAVTQFRSSCLLEMDTVGHGIVPPSLLPQIM